MAGGNDFQRTSSKESTVKRQQTQCRAQNNECETRGKPFASGHRHDDRDRMERAIEAQLCRCGQRQELPNREHQQASETEEDVVTAKGNCSFHLRAPRRASISESSAGLM